MNEFEELKEHCEKQKERYAKGSSAINRLGVHIWQDVLNKMWSIENKHKKATLNNS